MKSSLAFLLFLCGSICVYAQKDLRLSSPDGKLIFTFSVKNSVPSYDIEFKGKKIVEKSTLSPSPDGKSSGAIQILKTTSRKGIESYELLVGKTRKVSEPYGELLIPVENKSSKQLTNIVVRAFNDGLAFRYEYIRDAGRDSLLLTEEHTTFHFAGDPTILALPLPGYTSSHEGFYVRKKLSELDQGALFDMPALFESSGVFIGITEAALLDHAGMYLTREGDAMRSMLSPSLRNPKIKVHASFPHKSPWRVLLISDRVGALIESNILTNLNEPCAWKDVSWIKPGKITFPWWNGNVTPDTLNAPGNNFVTQQYYIDFCARNHIEYHSVVEYGLHQWYVDDGVGFQPGPNSDPTKTVPGLDMKEVCDYARSKGVGVRVWVQWAALYPKLDAAFAQFEAWGLQGMMIDFMDRDDQEMVNIQTEMLEKAAKHHLHIQFHGAYKNTGLHRTYPNEFTREGTLNYEINKWDAKGLPPDHDINIPFTRMLAGSTDYHLGGFRTASPGKYRQQYTRPLMLGTRCHMLAMYVVLENYQGMVCDYPDAYEGQPGFDFIQNIPTVFEETRVLDAKVGEYIVIARRKGNDWYVGGISSSKSKTVTVPLSFLNGSYSAKTYSDDPASPDNPDKLRVEEKEVKSSDNLTIQFSSGGGFAAVFRRD